MPHPAPQDRAMRRPVSTTLAAGVQPTEPGTFDVRPRTPATPDEVHDQGFGRFPLPVRRSSPMTTLIDRRSGTSSSRRSS